MIVYRYPELIQYTFPSRAVWLFPSHTGVILFGSQGMSMELIHLTQVPFKSQSLYASLWDRGLAKMIDFALLGICLVSFDLAFGTSFVIGGVGHASQGRYDVFVFLLFCLYSALLESSRHQATLGKRVMGIVVTDLDGNRISFGRALARSAMQWLSLIDYIPAVFSNRKQALHDYAVDTQVVLRTL